MCVACGKIFSKKEAEQRGFECWLEQKSREEYKVSGSGHRQSEKYLEQVKCCHDTDCTERMIKKGFTALQGGTWEED